MFRKQSPATDLVKALTWDALAAWAGSSTLSRGEQYYRSGRVKQMARTAEGDLVAWVSGTMRYATLVSARHGELVSDCTCPVGTRCKHAVALALQFLADTKAGKALPQVSEQDDRLAALQGAGGEDEFDGEDPPEDGYADDEDGAGRVNYTAAPDRRLQADRTAALDVAAFLQGQTREQLVQLVHELARLNPTVAEALEVKSVLAAAKPSTLVGDVRRRIRALSAEPGWQRHWDNEGYTPDYGHVRAELERLLQQGYANDVLDLGRELLEAGTNQVEMSDDEGETAEEIASCMDIVFRALPRSSLSPAAQLLWAIDADLQDEYDLTRGSAEFWDQEHSPEMWSAAADALAQRLQAYGPGPGTDGFSQRYRRDRLANWLIGALDSAGRQDEALAVCEREAPLTGSYERLVSRLIGAGRLEDAERWAREGIDATRERWPGIAAQLRSRVRELRERAGDWNAVASLKAEDFFAGPSAAAYGSAHDAAERAGVWPEVEPHLRRFLETGALPRPEADSGEPDLPPWPLPATDLGVDTPNRAVGFPAYGVLIDIAIDEGRLDEVLHWYDRAQAAPQPPYGFWWTAEDRIANALAKAYPDRSIAIWRKLAEQRIAEAQVKAYEAAAVHLRKVREALLGAGRGPDWERYLDALKHAHARKRRFIEILDRMESHDRPMLETL